MSLDRICKENLILVATLASFSGVAYSQQMPIDAGRILMETERAPMPELALPTQPHIDVSKERRPEYVGGESIAVTVSKIVFSGNASIPSAELDVLVADMTGKTVNLNGLRAAADKVTDYYREKGYLVARAYIPAQQITNGTVEIQVVEGRRDQLKINSNGDSIVRESVMAGMVDSAVGQGDVLYEADLERGLLLLSDTAGVAQAKGTLQPGSQVGTSNLIVDTDPANRFFGQVDADNFGGRSYGYGRVGLSAGVNSPTGFGDQLTFRGQTTGQHAGAQMNYGRASYQLPLGSSGLKMGAAYASMYYRLGNEFAGQGYYGSAGTASIFATYPFVRSRDLNFYAQAGFDNLAMKNMKNSIDYSDYTVNVTTAGFSGNSRDSLLSGGMNTFNVTGSFGNSIYKNVNGYADFIQATTGAAGVFQRYNLSLTRLQRVTDDMRGFVNIYGQLASKNLDSSQQFFLGGPSGVRAYPNGEAAGMQGGVGQFELHHDLLYNTPVGNISGFAFYDAGKIQLMKNSYPGWNAYGNLQNDYWLQGAGLGFKATLSNKAYMMVTWAHTIGSNPGATTAGNQSDGLSVANRVWMQGVYQF